MDLLCLWSWVDFTYLFTNHNEREGSQSARTKKPSSECSWRNKSHRKAISAEHTKIAKKNCQSFHNLKKIYSLKTKWKFMLCACRKEQCSNWLPHWSESFLYKVTNENWIRDTFSMKKTHCQMAFWQRKGKSWLNCHVITSNSAKYGLATSAEKDKGHSGTRHGLTLLRFKITLQFHWFSANAFNKGRDKINLNQEQNFLLNGTWVFPELILWTLECQTHSS